MNADYDLYMNTLRANLARAMAERNIQAKPLSKKAGLGETAVRDLLDPAKTQGVRLRTIINVANALDMTPGALLGIEASAPPNEDILSHLLSALLQNAPTGGWTASNIGRLTRALSYGLQVAKDVPASHASPDALAVVARVALDRFHAERPAP